MACRPKGWGVPDKTTQNDIIAPEQPNPLVALITARYDKGYAALSEKMRQKRFGSLHSSGVFRNEPELQELGGDGLKTGKPKSWTNCLEVQQGGFVGNLIGKIASPLLKAGASLLPGGGIVSNVLTSGDDTPRPLLPNVFGTGGPPNPNQQTGVTKPPDRTTSPGAATLLVLGGVGLVVLVGAVFLLRPAGA